MTLPSIHPSIHYPFIHRSIFVKIQKQGMSSTYRSDFKTSSLELLAKVVFAFFPCRTQILKFKPVLEQESTVLPFLDCGCSSFMGLPNPLLHRASQPFCALPHSRPNGVTGFPTLSFPITFSFHPFLVIPAFFTFAPLLTLCKKLGF